MGVAEALAAAAALAQLVKTLGPTIQTAAAAMSQDDQAELKKTLAGLQANVDDLHASTQAKLRG